VLKKIGDYPGEIEINQLTLRLNVKAGCGENTGTIFAIKLKLKGKDET
jgi:hypothetical protein